MRYVSLLLSGTVSLLYAYQRRTSRSILTHLGSWLTDNALALFDLLICGDISCFSVASSCCTSRCSATRCWLIANGSRPFNLLMAVSFLRLVEDNSFVSGPGDGLPTPRGEFRNSSALEGRSKDGDCGIGFNDDNC